MNRAGLAGDRPDRRPWGRAGPGRGSRPDDGGSATGGAFGTWRPSGAGAGRRFLSVAQRERTWPGTRGRRFESFHSDRLGDQAQRRSTRLIRGGWWVRLPRSLPGRTWLQGSSGHGAQPVGKTGASRGAREVRFLHDPPRRCGDRVRALPRRGDESSRCTSVHIRLSSGRSGCDSRRGRRRASAW